MDKSTQEMLAELRAIREELKELRALVSQRSKVTINVNEIARMVKGDFPRHDFFPNGYQR